MEQCVEIEYPGMVLMFKWFREQAEKVKSSLCSESPKDNSIAVKRIIRNLWFHLKSHGMHKVICQ